MSGPQSGDHPLVRYARLGGVVTITLDSPGNRNALSSRLVAALHSCLDRVESESGVRVVVLTHTGPAFCAGADLKERAHGTIDSTEFVRALRRLHDLAQPTIAAVNGVVRAGGIGLMATCDIVVAHRSVDFAFTETRLGVAPAIVAVPVMARVHPSALAVPFLTAEPFDASEAARIGLINEASDDVAASVERLAAGILAGAPGAVAETKRLLHAVPGEPFDETLAAMGNLSDSIFRSAEGVEGVASFRERRPPAWQPSS